MKCSKCYRTIVLKQTVEIDKKTKTRWVISACASCGYPFDLEEFNPRLHHYLKWQWGEGKQKDET